MTSLAVFAWLSGLTVAVAVGLVHRAQRRADMYVFALMSQLDAGQREWATRKWIERCVPSGPHFVRHAIARGLVAGAYRCYGGEGGGSRARYGPVALPEAPDP